VGLDEVVQIIAYETDRIVNVTKAGKFRSILSAGNNDIIIIIIIMEK
jgi:hypothetical protein